MARDTNEHVKGATAALSKIARAHPFSALVLACSDEIGPLVEQRLHPDLRRLLVGKISWDPEQDDFVILTQRGSELLEHLQLEPGKSGGAVGLGSTIDALNRDIVEVLLLERTLEASGVICPLCGFLGVKLELCPMCEKPMIEREDIVEDMLRKAVNQSAEIRFLRFNHSPRPGSEHMEAAAIIRRGIAYP